MKQTQEQLEEVTRDRDKLQLQLTTVQAENDVPIMETVNYALTTPEEALKHSAIFGFSPEEALADAHFQINMLTSNYDELENRHESIRRQLAQTQAKLAEFDAATILSDIRENQKNQPEQKSRRTQAKAQKIWTLKDIEEVLEAIRSPKQKTPTDAREPLNEGN